MNRGVVDLAEVPFHQPPCAVVESLTKGNTHALRNPEYISQESFPSPQQLPEDCYGDDGGFFAPGPGGPARGRETLLGRNPGHRIPNAGALVHGDLYAARPIKLF